MDFVFCILCTGYGQIIVWRNRTITCSVRLFDSNVW